MIITNSEGSNKEFGSKFPECYWVHQNTPKECLEIKQKKYKENINQDEDNSRWCVDYVNDILSQKFKQILIIQLVYLSFFFTL